MGRSAGTTSPSLRYVRWEEVCVSTDRGRREVHYYLKRKDGASDLAVIGREKNLRHMSYHHALRDSSFFSPPLMKLRSRREVVDWLNSIASGSDSHPNLFSGSLGGSLDGTESYSLDLEVFKSNQLQKLGQNTRDFKWLGSPWSCRKRRKHYQSFRRNGVTISVHDFAYVLAEEEKRLVAYLDDMYEDSRGNKMVVVRWFHKIDEVGFVLPHNYNDREVFFSLCLQDLSIECIDGLAFVLSPQHYGRFLKEATLTHLKPFVCHRQFGNDDVTPFDITQVKGYWKQEIMKCISLITPSNNLVKYQAAGSGLSDDAARPRKRLCHSKNCAEYVQFPSGQDVIDACLDARDFSHRLSGLKGATGICSLKEKCSVASLAEGKKFMYKQPWDLDLGSHIEVLSQDSGIRGCWFRAVIVKKHKDKVKVRYQDIKDAEDEDNNLEEWILASKVAVPDDLGIRIGGRAIVRPTPSSIECRLPWIVNIGTSVDVWWNDGWWEGIVAQKESENEILVYFPGEKRCSILSHGDLRHSQEWLINGWKPIKERPELVTPMLSDPNKQNMVKSGNSKSHQVELYNDGKFLGITCKEILQDKMVMQSSNSRFEFGDAKVKAVVQDLLKDGLLSQLRWNSSRKRSVRTTAKKVKGVNKNKKSSEATGELFYKSFLIPSFSKVDHDNCKSIGEGLFNSAVVSPLTSLVMSR